MKLESLKEIKSLKKEEMNYINGGDTHVDTTPEQNPYSNTLSDRKWYRDTVLASGEIVQDYKGGNYTIS